MIVCQYNRDWLNEKTIDLYFSQRRGDRRENCVVSSPDAMSQYPGYVMEIVRVSFR